MLSPSELLPSSSSEPNKQKVEVVANPEPQKPSDETWSNACDVMKSDGGIPPENEHATRTHAKLGRWECVGVGVWVMLFV